MEDCFVVFNPKLGFLKAQRWHKSLDAGVPHHGRYQTVERAIAAVELYMGKNVLNYQEIFDSYIINLADHDSFKSPTFALSLVQRGKVENTIRNLLSPISTGVSVSQLLFNIKRVYNDLDDVHTALKWNPRSIIIIGGSLKSEETKRIEFASSCAKMFSNAYDIAAPVYVDIGWFVFANPKDAMLFKMAISDVDFESVNLNEVVDNIQKETKRYLDKFVHNN